MKAGQIAQDSLDAINGSQLYSANQNVAKVLGGTSKFENGQLTGVDFSSAFTGLAEGEKIESVYGGFDKLDKRVDATSKVVDEINSGLGIGEDGESGSVGDVIGGIKDDVSNVVAGRAGLIKLNDDGTQIIVDNKLAQEADVFNIAKADEKGRTLTGVKAGQIAQDSLDAINGSQLYSANQNVAKVLGGISKFENGQLTGVDFSSAFTGLAEGEKIESVYGGFDKLDKRVDATSKVVDEINSGLGIGEDGESGSVGDVIGGIKDDVSNVVAGRAGLIKLNDDGTQIIVDNKLAQEADVFNIAKADEKGRTLTGVKAGQIAQDSLDAINGSQLYSANQNVAKVLGGTSKFENGQLTGVDFSSAFTGLAEGEKIESVYGGFDNLDKRVDATSKVVDEINSGLGIGEDGESGSVGDVIGSIKDDVSNVVAGRAGLIQLAGSDDSQKLIIDNELATDAKTFDFSIHKEDKTINRLLTGVAEGEISQNSFDAINGSQLHATNQNVAKVLGGTSKFENGQLTGVDFSGAFRGVSKGEITTVYAGFDNLDERVTELEKGQAGIVITKGKDKELFTSNQEETTKPNLVLATISQDSSKKEKEIGLNNNLVGSQDTFNIGGADLTETNETGDRTLTGVAKGDIVENSVDAINGSQLYASNQSIAEIFGGGARIDENGYITTPEYVIGDKTFNNVGASIKHLANSITAGEVGIFQLDREKNQIIIADNTDINSETTLNVGNRKIVGVANGKVEKGSQEAVNGGQLWETNQQVTSNTTQIKHINKTLDHYNNRISHLEKTVHENRKRASAGTASAMAMSSIPYMDYAKYSMGMGVASYDGEAAMSIGMEFKLGDNGRFRVQGSYDTQNKAGVGVGVAFSF